MPAFPSDSEAPEPVMTTTASTTEIVSTDREYDGDDGSVPIRPSLSRRALDVLVSGVALILLSPVMLLLALAVRLSSRGPVLFRQMRVGEGGKIFTLYKFRSMRINMGGPEVTAKGDARITGVGKFIRSTSLDELPQILNILLGHMTLVGPRPESPGLAGEYPANCKWVFAHRPGLTGPVQIRLRDNVALPDGVEDPEEYYLTVLVPIRVSTDRKFLENPSIGRTFLFIFATAWYLLAPKSYRPFGAHRAKQAAAAAIESEALRVEG
jgi:lipopolysaccharide/colanic/teichoic acid biosynthesis glycosyltransferase